MKTTSSRRPSLFTRALAVAAMAGALLPLGLASAQADAPTAVAKRLPPGVIPLGDGEPCPVFTLCLYRDYGFRGPAYGIGAGYDVDLRALPMPGSGGPTAANNVSSWVNHTRSDALLVDRDRDEIRPLFPGQRLEEPPGHNDTVDLVLWP
ncbi:peptidase inhibitor family I36 protein [Streptomyces sp. NPDC040750]|uniref:peptidase inhibitor family I36 protein n=1 Tax=Streptomyces sp. NPDC040750 TaxID=3154491 RepID=UPI0033CCAE16